MRTMTFFPACVGLRFLLALIAITWPAVSFAIEEVYRKATDIPAQKSVEFEQLEKVLDDQIRQVARRIEEMQVLSEFKRLDMSPRQTYFNVDPTGESIEMTEYDFGTTTPRPDVATDMFGMKKMKFFFMNAKLSRIECQITKTTHQRDERIVSAFVHQKPSSESPNNILVERVINDTEKHIVRVGDMENTKSNPFRINFKKDFYLAHLRQFEEHLRFTFDLHRRKASDRDKKTINHLKGKSD